MKTFLKFIGTVLLIFIFIIGGVLLSLESSPPETLVDLAPLSAEKLTSGSETVLIFGATRNTGLMAAELLHDRGDNVTAFVRPSSKTAGLDTIDAELVVGDAMDMETVRAAFAGRNVVAVLTTIGCLRCDPPVDYQANANVIRATVEAGVRRLILVTTIGAGDSVDSMPALSARILAATLPLKTQAEELLRTTPLDYTIIRPGGLQSGMSTGNGILSEDRETFGFIYRKDLAELIVRAFDDPVTIGKTLAAVDPNRRFPLDRD